MRAIAWETAFQIALRNYSKEIREELGCIGVFAGKQTNENNPPGHQLLLRLPRVAVLQNIPPFCFWGFRRHRAATSHLPQMAGGITAALDSGLIHP